MSGHSKWAKIKRQKGANDTARGALFTKLGRAITLAASEGGGDPDMNFSLRLAIDKAKAANMPLANIDRAVKRGTGEIAGEGRIESVTYEGYGPGGIAVLIDVQTDNTNRSVSEIRKLLETTGGKLAGAGSVSWMFEEKGLVVVVPAKLKKAEKYGAVDSYEPVEKSEVELELLEIDGIQDINESESEDEEGNKIPALEVITAKTDLAKVRSDIAAKGLKIETAELIKLPKDKTSLSGDENQRVNKMIEILEEHEDIQNVWVNASNL